MIFHTEIKFKDHNPLVCELFEDANAMHHYIYDLFERSNVRYSRDLYEINRVHVYTADEFKIKSNPMGLIDNVSIVGEEMPTGERFTFELLVNPIKTVGGKRVGIVPEDECRAWLIKHMLGCTVDALEIVRKGFNEITRLKTKRGDTYLQKITYREVHFNGDITITNEAEFEAFRLHGLGSGKAFGYGCIQLTAVIKDGSI